MKKKFLFLFCLSLISTNFLFAAEGMDDPKGNGGGEKQGWFSSLSLGLFGSQGGGDSGSKSARGDSEKTKRHSEQAKLAELKQQLRKKEEERDRLKAQKKEKLAEFKQQIREVEKAKAEEEARHNKELQELAERLAYQNGRRDALAAEGESLRRMQDILKSAGNKG